MNASQVAVRPVAPEDQRALDLARSTLAIEVQALQSMADRLNQVFAQVVQQILRLPGRVVVMGMGKSGHVGRKLAATLASTGTPAFFVHPAEASHGDLGMVTDKDLVLALSNSGESDEITSLLSALKRQGVGIVAMTGGLQSTLARHADWVLDTSVEREACPLNLAPTASTTAQLALGDALAMALLDARGFRAEDFARSHPGGSLGRKLLTHVADVMRSGSDVPAVQPDADFSTLMREMGAKGLGCAVVVDAQQQVQGIFTDGDLRRCIEAGTELRTATAGQLMHARPKTVSTEALAVDAAQLMEQHGITSVMAVDAAGRLAGIVHIRDLMRAKVI
ncbi:MULTISPECIES: KpsF/GutQ family sugar-phosphate isomerase [Comamonas]|jgi:arabinose-5-phosphate isomerase|uniref:KpsF/GutQ family sugar-phosphate isomerase n=1 Tax=Comamonas terrigena TaxID=32013 RepID=A0A2A7UR81_COMTR|nr:MULTISPECIES: KpsF/GutQ family sugar-phosphate isomerase [Comamonas]MBD9532844.1 KpsF/GutQ family sugar-phosphate isomerase [Comamonas sp. CMM01]MBV7419122.1 KpsF/GutQ family sugar-phosphate isomerase [Comamonas sp. CMM03]MDH0048725.1 KpsF/GutQ family sugar-phosphate isomerase [Comamonas terrigena]MDH0511705.1 KpsF/GutQ family sugar-phosphate isomerase [Comamonas terrigena]MDH1090837.1 KpsF/GutQ family sugar-phosphate isomerase [Comamonas terrigena]